VSIISELSIRSECCNNLLDASSGRRYFITGPFAGIGGQEGSEKWYVYVDDDHRPYFIMPGTEEAQYEDPRAYDWETARHAGDNVANAFIKANDRAHGIHREPAIDSKKEKKSGWFGSKKEV
jgi:hypothetical protein